MKRLNGYRIKSLVVFVVGMVLPSAHAKADFIFGEPVNLGPTINSTGNETGPCISSDNLELYFTANRPGGSGLADLHVATRQTTSEPWGVPTNLGPMVNSWANDFRASISGNGLSLYFTSDRPSTYGGFLEIWVTTRPTKDDPWGWPVSLGPNVNSTGDDGWPSISADELTLYFGSGGDLHVSTRSTTDEEWGVPVDLGPPLNGPNRDLYASISSDNRVLFFSSDRAGTYGGWDIWMTTRKTTEENWGAPINLGPPVNTSVLDYAPSIAADGSVLYFHSTRSGGYGERDIWQAPIIRIVDFNGDGKVDGRDLLVMADQWGTDDSLCDIGPMPWGDGVVDVRDLRVFAEYVGEPIDDPTLIAHWALDEADGAVARDSVGGRDGAILGEPIWQPEGGVVAGALQLDGVDDAVLVGSLPDLGDGPFSILVWVRGGAPGQALIAQFDGDEWLYANPVDGTLMTGLHGTGRSAAPLFSDAVVTDGHWHRVGVVWDGRRRMLCVDGREVASDGQAELPIRGTGLIIGGSAGPGSFFSGLVDDVRIYSRAVRPWRSGQ